MKTSINSKLKKEVSEVLWNDENILHYTTYTTRSNKGSYSTYIDLVLIPYTDVQRILGAVLAAIFDVGQVLGRNLEIKANKISEGVLSIEDTHGSEVSNHPTIIMLKELLPDLDITSEYHPSEPCECCGSHPASTTYSVPCISIRLRYRLTQY